MRTPFLIPALSLAATTLLLSSCGMMRAITPDISMPKLHLPSRNTVAAIIPGMGPEDKASREDPQVPFNSRGVLGYGHTLRLEVYEGSHGPKRIFDGIIMVDTEGVLALGEVGSARVGGLRLPQAAEAIATTFRLAGRNTRPITVQIISVENTSVIAVIGDVKEPGFIPAFDGMSVQHAVAALGGRKPGSTARGVYIAREGQRHFFTSLDSAGTRWTPRAGDIITLSPDI